MIATMTTGAADAAHASAAMLDALREADELMSRGEYGEPLREFLHFADDLLDIIAGYVQRPDAGEAERGAFVKLRERVATARATLVNSRGDPERALRTSLPAPRRVLTDGKSWDLYAWDAAPGDPIHRYAAWARIGHPLTQKDIETARPLHAILSHLDLDEWDEVWPGVRCGQSNPTMRKFVVGDLPNVASRLQGSRNASSTMGLQRVGVACSDRRVCSQFVGR